MASPMGDTAGLSGSAESLAHNGDRFGPLQGTHDCETLVIGGGVTGGSTAYHLAQLGRQVTLIEEEEIGWGGSGRSFGQIVAFGKHKESRLLNRYGGKRGTSIIEWLATGPDRVFDIIEKHGIECAARRTGLFFAAHYSGAEAGLKEKVDFWQAKGAEVVYMDAAETRERIGSGFYSGAMWDKRAGSINSHAFTNGLIHAAADLGAGLFTRTSAMGIRKVPGAWEVSTAKGLIRAESVAICTNAYSGNLWPKLKASIVPVRAYQLVSSPLDNAVRRYILPGGQSMTDTRRLFSGIRVLDDGRLHLSVGGPGFRPDGQADTAGAVERMRELFPDLPALTWEDSRTGWVAVNPGQAPKLHRLDDNAWAAIGYSGRGLAFGVLMGREIALRIADPNTDETTFPISPLRPLVGAKFGPLALSLALRHYEWLDRRELNKRRSELVTASKAEKPH